MTLEIPKRVDTTEIEIGNKIVRLTHLSKPFWPKLGITKRDLLQYYADISPVLLPHLRDRAMVMKRYPNGAEGEFFFMKRAPASRPEWIRICRIEHKSSTIDFPVIDDLPSLLWVVNLGCIDLNQWYGHCRNADHPDYLHFDLDPTEGAPFSRVRETALVVRRALAGLGMPSYAKTSGASGIHVYVPIVTGPSQKEVWTFAKALAQGLEKLRPKLVTTRFRIASRPARTVLVDYNQNAWGRTLASVYSVRPSPAACVSTPVTWDEIEGGIEVEDFRLDNVRERVERTGDLWKPLLARKGRFPLERALSSSASAPIRRTAAAARR